MSTREKSLSRFSCVHPKNQVTIKIPVAVCYKKKPKHYAPLHSRLHNTMGPSFVARRKVAQAGAASAVQVSSGAARRAVSLAVW